jgi:hypothetical protein
LEVIILNTLLASVITKLHKQQTAIRTNLSNRYFVMTVDVDGWSSLLSFYSVNHDPKKADAQVSIEEGLSKVLELFEKNGIKSTFFVTGEMAKNHAQIIREISQKGHEIACHGLTHQKDEFLLSRASQERSIKEATRIIKEVIHVQPEGFRAPCLRLNETTLSILEENGYVYDSSVIPTFIPGYYGVPNAPSKPYHPSRQSLSKKGDGKFLELPVSVNPLLPFPLSAAWMRNFGSSWVKLGIKTNFLFGNPVVFYVHPRDVLTLPKVKGVPWHLYRNTSSRSINMLDNVLNYVKSLDAVFVRAIDLAFSIRNEDGEKEEF